MRNSLTFLIAAVALALGSQAAAADPTQFQGLLTNTTDYTASWPSPSMPAPGDTYTDPVWKTTTTRMPALTDCLQDATHTSACSARAFYPDYSKQQAWNSDGSKFLLLDQEGWYHLYNSATLTEIRRISDATGLSNDHDVRWSNSDPNLIYYVDRAAMSLKSYDISTRAVTVLHVFSCSDGTHSGDRLGNGDEGNSDTNDRYWPEVCSWYDGAHSATISVIVYDRIANTETANAPAATLCGGSCSGFSSSDLINWVGVSPSGNNLIVQWNKNSNIEANYVRPMGTELFTPSLSYVGKLCAENSHADVGYDINGQEVIVQTCDITYHPKTLTVTKLSDRTQTRIAWPSSWTSDASSHISMRSNVPGWALVSTLMTAPTQGSGFGASELLAVKVDSTVPSSSAWYRIGRTFSIRNTQYYAEPHAVPNRDFTKVLWGSDWLVDGGTVSPYTIALDGSYAPIISPSTRRLGTGRMTGLLK